MRLVTTILLMLAMSRGACAAPQTAAPAAHTSVDEVWRIVHDNFFDPEFNGVDWPAALERCRERCRGEASSAAISRHINAMLAELDASHTRFYRSDALEYYELLDIYRHALGDELKRVFATGVVRCVSIGAVMRQGAQGEPTIIDAYEGGPAHSAGLIPGDVLVVADDRLLLARSNCGSPHWVLPTLAIPRAQDTPLALRVRRADALKEVTVTPRVIMPHEMFLESMRRSARVIERDGQRLAYVRIRSWAGEEYQDLLIDLLNAEPLRSCDGLVLDIRGGWGGANPDAIGVFGCDSPALELIARDGQRTVIEAAPSPIPSERQWRKPVTLLVDEGTRSGKEVFAHAFKEDNRGTIVGTRTAGAVLGGKPFLLSDGSLLIVAVADVRVDGVRLEGVGVEPDVVVERGPIESGDSDAQLDRAAAALIDRIAARRKPAGPATMSDHDDTAPRGGAPPAIFPVVSQTRSTIIFTGRVQGVGFRATTESIAQRFAVTGWVRNERDGSVLCVAEGEDAEVERFIAAIKQAMHAHIRDAQITRSPATGEFSGFGVRH